MYPAHGPDLDGEAITTQYIAHRNGRTEQVAAALTGRKTAREIAGIVYAGMPVDLGLAAVQVRAHLTFLVERGAAVRFGGGGFGRGCRDGANMMQTFRRWLIWADRIPRNAPWALGVSWPVRLRCRSRRVS